MGKIHDIELINKIVEAPDAEWLIAGIIAAYGYQSPNKAAFVLNKANAVAQNVMLESVRCQKAIVDANESLLHGSLEDAGRSMRDMFRWLVPICVAIAPTPQDALSYTGEHRKYIDKLIELLHERNAYNPFYSSDRQWAKDNGYFQYLEIIRIDLKIC